MSPREFMRLTGEKYDVVVHHASAHTDPVHASTLTLDFMLLVRSVLKYDGIFCYVLDVTAMTRECLMTTVSAYLTSFPYAAAWYAGAGRVALLGSMEPLVPSETEMALKLERPWVSNDLKRLQINDVTGVFANLMMNRETLRGYLGAFSSSNTDARPCMACDAAPSQPPVEVLATLSDINKFSMNPVELISDYDKDSMEFKLARDRYDRCREGRNYYVGSYLALAAGDQQEAARRLEYGVSMCPANGLLKERLSYLYVYVSRDLDAAGRFEEAINVARRAIEVSPASYLAFYNLALLERKRDPETAIALLERLSQLNPDFLLANILKAQLLLEIGRPSEASDVISGVLSREPMNTQAHHVRALCFVERGLTEAARVELEFVLEAEPDNAEALAALGYTWLLVGDMGEAERYYSRALSLDPENLGTLNNYATILAEKGKYREAIVVWQRALRLDPGNAGIKANIREATEKMGAD
jgi:tetratricopeptide (TPR) repeat protein